MAIESTASDSISCLNLSEEPMQPTNTVERVTSPPALTQRLLLELEVALVVSPLKATVPFTEKVLQGLVVPTPTLPAFVTTSFGLFAESAIASAKSVATVDEAVTEWCAHGENVPMPVCPGLVV